ncbi:MAG: hypothetical protein HY063_14605 [Bacteroidetes bacterium]|nr:hypothetical protein [Bacteroidota bacterium]
MKTNNVKTTFQKKNLRNNIFFSVLLVCSVVAGFYLFSGSKQTTSEGNTTILSAGDLPAASDNDFVKAAYDGGFV